MDFKILQSTQESALNAVVPADIALCKECLEEMWNPKIVAFIIPLLVAQIVEGDIA